MLAVGHQLSPPRWGSLWTRRGRRRLGAGSRTRRPDVALVAGQIPPPTKDGDEEAAHGEHYRHSHWRLLPRKGRPEQSGRPAAATWQAGEFRTTLLPRGVGPTSDRLRQTRLPAAPTGAWTEVASSIPASPRCRRHSNHSRAAPWPMRSAPSATTTCRLWRGSGRRIGPASPKITTRR